MAAQPTVQAPIAARGRRERRGREPPSELVEHRRDMNVFVRVDPADHALGLVVVVGHHDVHRLFC